MSPPSQREFVALLAMLFAMIALSIDAMLPALPAIAAELSPEAPNRASLVVTAFVFGTGFGTLVSGPLSDAFGRKWVIVISGAVFMAGSALSALAPSLETLLIARVLQGLGGAAPRAVGTAMLRDLYKGREMARILSFVMTVFTLVPAVAPLLGQGVLAFGGWRTIFVLFIAFSVAINLWFALRQPETLAVAARRPLRLRLLVEATVELARHRVAMVSLLIQSLTLACLFALLSSIQGIFEMRFDRGESFPLWFAVIAVCAMGGNLLNARLVMTMGMRGVLARTYLAQVLVTGVVLSLSATGLMPEALDFAAHMVWFAGIVSMMGLTMGNLNAMAMETLGHLAGFAASAIAAFSTMFSVLLAIPVSLAFDGTAVPLMVGTAVFALGAMGLVRLLPVEGR